MAVHGVDDARVRYFAALAVLAVHDFGSHWSPAGNSVVASARCGVSVAFSLSRVRHISVHNAARLRRNQPSMASPLLLEMRQKPYDELGLLWAGKRTNGLSVFTALAALIEAHHGLVWDWCSACGDVLGVAEVVDYYHMLAAVALYLEV